MKILLKFPYKAPNKNNPSCISPNNKCGSCNRDRHICNFGAKKGDKTQKTQLGTRGCLYLSNCNSYYECDFSK